MATLVVIMGVLITVIRLAPNGITMDPDLYPAAADNGDAFSYLACVYMNQ